MYEAFTTDPHSFALLHASWRMFARGFVERSPANDWESRVPQEFVEMKPVIAHEAGHATVLDLQSRSKRKFVVVVQFRSEDRKPDAVAWMQKFGDSSVREETVDLLRINCSGAAMQLPCLSALFEEFIVNDYSASQMGKLIHSLGIEPLD